MAKDAGNTPGKAKRLGILSKAKSIEDLIGGGDRFDFYQFSLIRRSSLKLTLKKLKAPVDVAVLDDQKKSIQRSYQSKQRNKAINVSLNPGVYYIKISARTKQDETRYRLQLSVKELANSAPRLTSNTGLTLQRGATAIISQQQLQATDLEQSGSDLVYTITTLPSYGRLQLNDTPLQIGDRFTQADIAGNRLSFTHTGRITQLTNNSTRDLAAGISGTSITWNGFADNASETTEPGTSATVFFYNVTTGQTTPLSSSDSLNFASGISDSRVVWTGLNTFGLPKVFLSDGQTQQTTPLTSGLFSFGAAPVIANSSIAWTGISVTGSDIFFYDAATGQTSQITDTTANEVAVSVFGNNVLYNTVNSQDQPQEVFLYSGSTGRSIQLSNGSGRNSAIAVSGTKVAWNGFDGNDYEIFMYDLASGQTAAITNNTVDDVAPITTGLSGNHIIWNQLSENGEDSNVFLYNGSIGQAIQLTSSSTSEVGLSISGANVVWSTLDVNGQALEVFFYNGSSNITTQLTNNSLADFGVGVSGSRVVWNEFDGSDFEVLLADLEYPSSTDRFEFTVTDSAGGSVNGSFNFNIS